MATERLCQLCGRPATYVNKNNKYRGNKKRIIHKARNDHDLCGSCFHKVMQGVRASELVERQSRHNPAPKYIMSDVELAAFAEAIVAILNLDRPESEKGRAACA